VKNTINSEICHTYVWWLYLPVFVLVLDKLFRKANPDYPNIFPDQESCGKFWQLSTDAMDGLSGFFLLILLFYLIA